MTSSVLVALRVKADPIRTFAAFTREIGEWWRPDGLFMITAEGDGVLAFEGEADGRLVSRLPNGRLFEVGRIVEWREGERLVFTWRPATFFRSNQPELKSTLNLWTTKRGSPCGISGGRKSRKSTRRATVFRRPQPSPGLQNGGAGRSAPCRNGLARRPGFAQKTPSL